MTFNINDRAFVRLTEHGKRILREYHDLPGMPRDTYEYFRPQWETDEPVEFTVWELMNIFGPTLFMGSPDMPFVKSEITLKKRPA